MKTKTHFAFRVDIWNDTGDRIVEHVAGVDFEVGEATYRAGRGAPGPRRASPCGRVRGCCMTRPNHRHCWLQELGKAIARAGLRADGLF